MPTVYKSFTDSRDRRARLVAENRDMTAHLIGDVREIKLGQPPIRAGRKSARLLIKFNKAIQTESNVHRNYIV